jgi:hypothetical protein
MLTSSGSLAMFAAILRASSRHHSLRQLALPTCLSYFGSDNSNRSLELMVQPDE